MNPLRQNILIYPRHYFTDDVLFLRQHQEMLLNVVFNQTEGENQWLVRKFNQEEVQQTLKEKQSKIQSKRLLLSLTLLKNRLHPDSNAMQVDYLTDGHLYLNFDSRTKINSISGYFRHENKIVNLDSLFLVGAGMQKIISVNSKCRNLTNSRYERFLDSEYAKTRWEMTRKALGENVWKRLCLLKIMIIGGGRSGEAAFIELARLGVGQISICDGDILEPGNLGEMKLVTDQDLGRNKAEAIVEKVTKLRQTKQFDDYFNFQAIKSFNFDGIEARQIAKESDVIICCVDSDGGRDYASYIASRYHKVLLDIGTGILPNQTESLQKGYDVRLILPGEGCLRCCGGINESQSELEIFNSNERNRQRKEGRRIRAGSLSSLNNTAVNEGLLLLQDLCKGLVKNSTWVQFEQDSGRTVLSPIPNNKTECNYNC